MRYNLLNGANDVDDVVLFVRATSDIAAFERHEHGRSRRKVKWDIVMKGSARSHGNIFNSPMPLNALHRYINYHALAAADLVFRH